MSKSSLRLKAIKFRLRGMSVRDIANILGVAKSSASIWVRHVILSPAQLEELRKRPIKASEKARLKNSLALKEKRLSLVKSERILGEEEFKDLSYREFMIAGLSLYWAEGTKKNRKINFCNSDPKMIKFFINWVGKVYGIPRSELSCYVGINEAHRSREPEVKEFWSNLTGIPLENFTKTSFKKYPLKKIFENFREHYGTLAVQVRKPARIVYKILGQIHGLSLAT